MSWKDLFRRKTARKQGDESGHDASAGAAERIAAAKQKHRDGNVAEAEAVYLDIVQSDPGNAEARHMAGVVCLDRGQLQEAEQYFRQAIDLDDSRAAYFSNLGNVYVSQNRIEDAYRCFEQALLVDPQHLGSLSNASTALLALGRAADAKPLCQKILALDPNDVGARLNLAAAYMEEHDIQAAIAILREGLAIQPGNLGLLVQLASALEFANQLDEASAIVEQAESIQPGVGRITLLSGLIRRRQRDYDGAADRIQLAMDQGLSEPETVEALNQLGLSLDGAGRAAEAFAAFEQCNRNMSHLIGPKNTDGSAFLREVSTIGDFFTRDKFAALGEKFATGDNYQPVFFVSFPRSGTTLMEQVLKAHPKLITTEEISPLAAVVHEIRASAGAYPRGLDMLSAEDLTRLRQYFRDFCQDKFGQTDEEQVVDKLPLNIVHLGLAKLLFPAARIVVAVRDPRDACLSCFMQKFKINSAMANFLDLQSTGLTYQAVMDLWLHYRTVLGDSWLEYRYEDLVDDFDKTVRQVLDFTGAGWHENVADYRQAAEQRVISTPSYRDVTSAINKSAVDRWRRYEKELAPILPLLEPFVETFEYPK